MCGMPSQTCLMSKKNREALQLDVNGLVVVRSNDQDTSVVRRILKAPNIPQKDAFVFLSPDDLNLLNVNIADNVELSQDTEGVET